MYARSTEKYIHPDNIYCMDIALKKKKKVDETQKKKFEKDLEEDFLNKLYEEAGEGSYNNEILDKILEEDMQETSESDKNESYKIDHSMFDEDDQSTEEDMQTEQKIKQLKQKNRLIENTEYITNTMKEEKDDDDEREEGFIVKPKNIKIEKRDNPFEIKKKKKTSKKKSRKKQG